MSVAAQVEIARCRDTGRQRMGVASQVEMARCRDTGIANIRDVFIYAFI